MDGIIIVNKEKGFTSHDVVAKLRGILHQKKIGHTGTLDPDATGVLPVCVGRATKVCDVLTDRDKTYEAEVVLGITTDTLDTTGIIRTVNPVDVTGDGLMTVLSQFTGEITQVPPMYSAVKINGKKLYEYARAGQTVERKPRHVTVHEIELLDKKIDTFLYDNSKEKYDESADEIVMTEAQLDALPSFRLRIRCSKGTYIRTLCDDIGRALGCGAAMRSLVRTAVGRFTIDQSLTLREIQALVARAQAEVNSCRSCGYTVEDKSIHTESTDAKDINCMTRSCTDAPASAAGTDSRGACDEGTAPDRVRRLPANLADLLIPIDSIFDSYPRVSVADSALGLLANGNALPARSLPAPAGLRDGDIVRVYHADEFYALYRFDKNRNQYKVEKFFH